MTTRQLHRALGVFALIVGAAAVPSAAQAPDVPPVNGFVSLGAGFVDPKDFTLVGIRSQGSDRTELSSLYSGRRKPVIDFGGGAVFRRHLSVGAALSRYSSSGPATLMVTLTHPASHPPLSASADSAPVDRTQTSLHLQAGYLFSIGPRATVTVLGGPSYVRLAQGLLANPDFEEGIDRFTGRWYILGPTADTRGDAKKASGWGYNVGADVTYRLSSIVGVGALARYTRAAMDLENPNQEFIDDHLATQSVTVGGLEVTGGLRLRFDRSASARGRDRAWDVEAHAGGTIGNSPGGTVTMPHPGGAFTTFDGLPSRAVPSWYFGDGAQLLAQNTAARGRSTPISSLDPVLNTSSVRAALGRTFGARVGRALTTRLAVEFGVDVSRGGLALTDRALAAIESGRSTFEDGFRELLATDSTIARGDQRVSSSSIIVNATGSQIVTAGALRVNLLRGRAFTPYVTAGGGVISQTGDLPTVTLRGTYQFMSVNNNRYGQYDEMTFRFTSAKSFAPLVGGGLTLALSPRSGLRADTRALLAPDTVKVLMGASGGTYPESTRSTFRFAGVPSIQISTASLPSTLSAPLPETEVATGDGRRVLVNVSVGYYWRF